jgi:hypothetical protein
VAAAAAAAHRRQGLAPKACSAPKTFSAEIQPRFGAKNVRPQEAFGHKK